MKPEEVKKIGHGLYRVYWKKSHGGGSSLAAIGSTWNGERWMAPTNWISGSSELRSSWEAVKKVKLIKGK